MNTNDRIRSVQGMLDDALRIALRLERRMIGQSSAIINATTNADRLTIANSAESVRQDLGVIIELLRDSMRTLTPLPTDQPTPDGEEGMFQPDELAYFTDLLHTPGIRIRCRFGQLGCGHLMLLHHYRQGCVLPGCDCEVD